MLSEKNTQFNFVAHQIDFFMCVCVWLIIIIIFSLGKSLKPTFFFVAIINANARVKHCEWLGIFKICQFTQQRHVKKGTKLDSFSFLLLLSNSYSGYS